MNVMNCHELSPPRKKEPQNHLTASFLLPQNKQFRASHQARQPNRTEMETSLPELFCRNFIPCNYMSGCAGSRELEGRGRGKASVAGGMQDCCSLAWYWCNVFAEWLRCFSTIWSHYENQAYIYIIYFKSISITLSSLFEISVLMLVVSVNQPTSNSRKQLGNWI